MNILIACEFSGVVRDAFIARGHNAMSCDILPTDVPGPHYQGDVLGILDWGWDMMVAFPPCTYLCTTGNKWMKPEFVDRFPDRSKQRQDAIEFFLNLYNAEIPKIVVENPVGVMSSVFRKLDQYVHPFHFGEPHSKKTGLWLRGLLPLVPTEVVAPEMYTYKNGKRDPVWHVKSMKLPPEERMKFRSSTFQGIADAMAEQWG